MWYNHLKLRDIRERVAAQHAAGGGGGAGKEKAGDEEERQPLVDVVVAHRWAEVSRDLGVSMV